MNAEYNSGLPAFPIKCLDGTIEPGLTKRELFAAMAMQGIIAKTTPVLTRELGHQIATVTAVGAVDYADALVTELARARKEEA